MNFREIETGTVHYNDVIYKPAWVNELPISGNEMMAFCAILGFSERHWKDENHWTQGGCYASVDTLAHYCRCCPSHMRAALKRLIDKNLIINWEKRPGYTDIYTVNYETLDKWDFTGCFLRRNGE